MKLRVLLASALLLPACAARRASSPPTAEPTSAPLSASAPASEPTRAPIAVPSTEPTSAPAAAPAPEPVSPPVAFLPPAPQFTEAPPTALQRETGPIGTRHPLLFQRAAEDGRWLIACQAREDTNGDGKREVIYGRHGDTFGDRLAPYLFLEPGEGERLDDFLAADPTGRYLVVVRGGSMRLLDTYTRADAELAPPGTIPDSTAPSASLPVSFSRDGQRLLLVSLSGPEKRATAFLINLQDGSRREVPHGPGLLGRAVLDPEGQWVWFGVVTQDTDGDGQLTWPRAQTSLASRYCRGPIMSYGQYGQEGDTASWLLRRVDGGPLVPREGVLRPLGDALLRQGEQGEVFVEQSSGQRTEWVPASCRAHVLHVDAAREQVLVTCSAQGNALELHGARVHQPLGIATPYETRPPPSHGPLRLFPVVPTPEGGAPSPSIQSVVDLETRTVHPMRGEVQYTEGTRALVQRDSRRKNQNRRLWFVDTATGEQRELGEQRGYGFVASGNFVYSEGLLVDMSTGRLVRKVPEDAQALDTRGRMVLDRFGLSRTVPSGPLQWTPAVGSR
ncbi:MAG TPA: hypothetical protein VFZ09_27965 [Archangium sp.]|uniref:hypothetical protein n=1 Tax=Archangium sp. TaxID=1872627 RepID=UPI002E355012|nr:hypothetical protein [Archangium sp.]HEX5750098.1 hypothetical protein [Archangium sp.]